MRSPLLLTAATFAAQAVALPAGDGIKRYQNSTYEEETKRRADAVKAVFQTAWDGYYQYVSQSSMERHAQEEKLTNWLGTPSRTMSSLR